ATRAPHLGRAGRVADRTAAGRAFEELFGCDDWEERGFHQAEVTHGTIGWATFSFPATIHRVTQSMKNIPRAIAQRVRGRSSPRNMPASPCLRHRCGLR